MPNLDHIHFLRAAVAVPPVERAESIVQRAPVVVVEERQPLLGDGDIPGIVPSIVTGALGAGNAGAPITTAKTTSTKAGTTTVAKTITTTSTKGAVAPVTTPATTTKTTATSTKATSTSATSTIPTTTPRTATLVPFSSTATSTTNTARGTVTSTKTAPTPSGTNLPNNNAADSAPTSSSSGLSSVAIGLIATGAVIVAIIAIGFIVRRVYASRRRARRGTWGAGLFPGGGSGLPPPPEPWEKPLPDTSLANAAGRGALTGAGAGAGAARGYGYGSTGTQDVSPFADKPLPMVQGSEEYGVAPAGEFRTLSMYSNTPSSAGILPSQAAAPPPPPVPAPTTFPAYPQAAVGYATQPGPYPSFGVGGIIPGGSVGGGGGYAVAAGYAGFAAGNTTPPNAVGTGIFAQSAYNSQDLSGPAPLLRTTPPPTNSPFSGAPLPIGGSGAAGETQIAVVKRTFIPSLPDELSISTGESVRVVSVYDDGWALCEKLAGARERGVVPVECLDGPLPAPAPAAGPAAATQTAGGSALGALGVGSGVAGAEWGAGAKRASSLFQGNMQGRY